MVFEVNEIGPGNVGTVDVKQALLNMKPAWATGIGQEYEQLTKVGV